MTACDAWRGGQEAPRAEHLPEPVSVPSGRSMTPARENRLLYACQRGPLTALSSRVRRQRCALGPWRR